MDSQDNNNVEILTPVSYTHLDVYKRQDYGFGDYSLQYVYQFRITTIYRRLCRLDKDFDLSGRNDIHGCPDCGKCKGRPEPDKQGPGAVSKGGFGCGNSGAG